MRVRLQRANVQGRRMDADLLAECVRAAVEETGCVPEVARPFLQPFLHCLMDARAVDVLCWQVAGNRKRLKDSHCQLYGGRREEMGWMAARIDELQVDAGGGESYRIRVLDGPAAGLDLRAPVPRFLWATSDLLGYTRTLEDRERIRISRPEEAVRCEVLVLPDPVPVLSWEPAAGGLMLREDSRKTSAGAIRATSSQQKRNRALAEERAKRCDKGLSGPCHSCPRGYDRCLRSCRPHAVAEAEARDVILKIEGRNLCLTKKPETSSEPV
jgi:hypothetical protein